MAASSASSVDRIVEAHSQTEFQKFLTEKSKQVVVVHFWAPWCEPCQQINENLALLITEIDETKICFLKLEAEKVPEVSLEYKITAVPTILFIKSNRVFDRLDGYHPGDLTKKIRLYSTSSVLPVFESNGGNNRQQKQDTTTSSSSSDRDAGHDQRALEKHLESLINQSACVLFMKGSPTAPQCGFSNQICQLLDEKNVDYTTFDILLDDSVRQGLKKYSNWPTFPQLYLKGQLLGGLDVIREEFESGDLDAQLPKKVSLTERLEKLTCESPVMVFMKGNPSEPKCKFSRALMDLLAESGVKYGHFDILNDEAVRQGLKEYSKWPTYPQVYVGGKLIGGLDVLKQLKESNELEQAFVP